MVAASHACGEESRHLGIVAMRLDRLDLNLLIALDALLQERGVR